MPGDKATVEAQKNEQELRATTTDTKTQTVGEAMQKEQETRAQQITKEQADKLYEERMEEEYAKREGGA